MNWQALNPLRLASASKQAASAVWRRRPALTKRTVAWGTALSMLTGGGGYYGYQKLTPSARVVAQVKGENGAGASSKANSQDDLQPIPDAGTGEPGGAVGVMDAGAPVEQEMNEREANEQQGGSFGGAPQPGMFVGDSGGTAEPSADAGVETGPPAEGGTEYAADGSQDGAELASGRPRVMSMREGPVESGMADDRTDVSEEMPVEVPAEAGDPAVTQVVDAEASPPSPGAIADAANAGDEANGAESGAPGQSLAPPPTATFADTPGTAPPSGSTSAGDAAESENAPRADLVPVPTRPVPPPPEEHVRLPAEASPDLSPRGFSAPPAAESAAPRPAPYSRPPASSFSGAEPEPRGSVGMPRVGTGVGVPEPAGLPGMVAGVSLPLAASAVPGAKHLEGPQTPTLELEKIAPEEVQVGRPARFEIKVRNVGRVAAQHVSVVDQIPQGTRLLDTNPPCQRGQDGALRWNIGALGPGQEASIVLQLLPEQEGEIGSVAQVIFHSQAAVRTVATRPQIRIEHQVTEQALIGDQVKVRLAIVNRGSGATQNLVLDATLPEGLAHPAGAELEYPIGSLRPGETKPIELTLKAVRPGTAPCAFVARDDGQTLAEERTSLEIVAPQLQVAINGPKVRYLDRQATYNVAIANPGTAAATNLELMVFLPRGLKFVSADNQGQYDSQRHAVLWGLAELPAGVMGASQLIVVPTEPGEQRIRAEAQADLSLEHAFEQPVLVETLSELQFTVVDAADPIELGSDTTYEIRIQNRGSRAATQVRVAVEFPGELTPVAGEGPTAVEVRGQQIAIEPIGRLAPNSQVAYQIRARGARTGDPRIRVLVSSDEAPTPVTKEESTRVYSDE